MVNDFMKNEKKNEKNFNDYLADYLSENNFAIITDDTEIRTVVIPKEHLKDAKKDLVLFSAIDVFKLYFDYELYDFARNYWTVTKHRLKSDPSTKKYIDSYRFKVTAKDGKLRYTDFLDADHLFEIIEYISYSKVIICSYPKMMMAPRVDKYTRAKDKRGFVLMLNKFSLEKREDDEREDNLEEIIRDLPSITPSTLTA